MSDKKKSDSGSNKGYSRFKFWSRKNQSSDNSSVQTLNSQEPSEDPGQDINLSLNPNLNQVKSQPEIKKSGGERYGLEMKKKKTLTKFPSQQEKVVRANNNSSNSLKTYSQSQERRPRTLGNKQVANQPINLPIKESLKIMRDVMIKITNATSESEKSSVEHEVEPPIIDENVLKDEPIIMPESVQETTEEVVSEPAQEITVEEVVEEVVEEIKEVAEKVVETIEDVVENTVKKIVEEVVSDSVQEIAAPEVESEFAEKNAAEETEEQDETSMDDSYFEAVNLYRLGLAGDKEAVAKAYELLKTILQKDPDNHLAQAYLGSVTSLLGRDGNDQNERFKFAIKGLKILDRVVSFVPDNIEIRGLRAFLCGKLPEQYFHRSETAIEDFSFLVARYDEDNSLFPKEFYCQLLLELGLAYNRLDKKKEAESTCRKLLSITDDPKYEALVKQEGILVSKSKRQKLAERIYASKSNWTKAKDNEKLEEAVALYRRALDHDKLAVDQAYDIFNLLQKRNPQDPLIRAYYADCLSLLAQSSADTSVLFRHATHSIKNLDQAVNASPDNITIRFIRGYNSYRIPEAFFKRTFTAIHDFEYLISKYEQDPSIFEQEIYLQLLRDLGHSYERLELDEEAKAAWNKLSQSDNPEYSTLGSEMLNGNTETSFSKLGDNPSVAELIQEGIRLYEFAEGGNKKAGLKAQELLRRACFADPVNSLAEGYYGMSIAVTGRNSTDPGDMFRSFFKGLNHLKKAVAREPKNYKLHLLLANLYHNFSPNFFPASDKALKEFKFLKTHYEMDNSIFPEEVYYQVLYDLGVCYQAEGDTEKAHKTWDKLSKITADPKFKVLSEVREEGDGEMVKESSDVREKYKEIAEELARERKEKSERREKKRSRNKGKVVSKVESKEESKEEPQEESKGRHKGKSTRKQRKIEREKALEMVQKASGEKSKKHGKKRTSEDQPLAESTRKLKKKDLDNVLEKVQELSAKSSKRRDKKNPGEDQPEDKKTGKLKKKDRDDIIEMVRDIIMKKTEGRRNKDKDKPSVMDKVEEKLAEVFTEGKGE